MKKIYQPTEKIEELEQIILSKQKKIEKLEEELFDYKHKQNITLVTLSNREEKLKMREAILDKRELELNLALMTKERDCAIKNIDIIFNLLDKFYESKHQ